MLTRPLLIAILTERMPASEAAEVTGGVEARCHYVARMLAASCDVVTIAERTTGSNWAPASLRSIPHRLRFSIRALCQLLRGRFDVVDASNMVCYPIAWLGARLRGAALVFWVPDVMGDSTTSSGLGLAGFVLRVIERLALRLPADQYIAISQATAGKLVSLGVAASKITVVPCGFDGLLVDRLRHERLASPPLPRLIVVSRLVSYKRVDVVLMAVASLRADIPGLAVTIVGQGPERTNLERLAADLGIADIVRFAGFIERHEDVLRLVAESRCLVSASEIEGFGIALVEGMALGTPYVISDIAAHREVSGGGVGGALVPVGDIDAMAQEIRRTMGDDASWTAKSLACSDYAGRYLWETIALDTEGVYKVALDIRRDGRAPRRQPKKSRATAAYIAVVNPSDPVSMRSSLPWNRDENISYVIPAENSPKP